MMMMMMILVVMVVVMMMDRTMTMTETTRSLHNNVRGNRMSRRKLASVILLRIMAKATLALALSHGVG